MTKEEARKLIQREIDRGSNWIPSRVKQIVNELKRSEKAILAYNSLLNIVCEVCGVSPFEVMSKNRRQEVVRARNILYLHYLGEGCGYSEIGRMFDRNHSNVWHGEKAIKKDIESNYKPTVRALAQFKERLSELTIKDI